MLIAQLQQMTQLIAELRSREQQADNADAFGTRARQLEEPSAQLEGLASIAQEFQRRGIPLSFNQGQVAALAKQVDVLATAYREDRQSIIDPTGRFTLWNPLKTLPDEVRTTLLQAWSGYITSTLPERHPELLQTLGQLPGFKEPVDRVGQLYREADRMRGQLPRSTDEIERVAAIASELRATWQQLPTENIPAEIQDFLTQAVLGEARYSQLTASVIEWLRTNDLLKHVRISMKA